MCKVYFKEYPDPCVMLKTPCKYRGYGVKIGSISCQKCKHNQGFNSKEMWVKCVMHNVKSY